MPRKLPWLQNSAHPASVTHTGSSRTRKRQHNSTPDPEQENTTGVSTPRRLRRNKADRTPSTSPLPEPPIQEFMRDGLAGDDLWIMVEDEFQETARLFTQHLHQAEYHRLKHLAKSQNASVIQSISRPVDTTSHMSIETRRKLAANAKAKAQKDALGGVINGGSDGEEEEDEPWIQDPRLAGLMTRSRDATAPLATLTGVASNTRAAAGYSQTKAPSLPDQTSAISGSTKKSGRHKEGTRHADAGDATTASEDDGDLDARSFTKPVSSRPAQIERRPPARSEEPVTSSRPLRPSSAVREDDSTRQSSSSSMSSRPVNASQSSAQSSISASSTSKSFRTIHSKSTDLEDVPKRQALPASFAERMAKRKTMLAKKEQVEKRKFLQLDEIPTFLV